MSLCVDIHKHLTLICLLLFGQYTLQLCRGGMAIGEFGKIPEWLVPFKPNRLVVKSFYFQFLMSYLMIRDQLQWSAVCVSIRMGQTNTFIMDGKVAVADADEAGEKEGEEQQEEEKVNGTRQNGYRG